MRRDYVKKIAVYRDRLAVQLSDRIIIYETVPVDSVVGGGGSPSSPTSPTSPSSSAVAAAAAAAAGAGAAAPMSPALTTVRGPWELQAAAAGVGVLAGLGASREAASASSSATMMYRFKDRVAQSLECSLLVVTSMHVVLCLDKRLSMLSFSGVREREWVLDSVIRYIKVVGGPPGGEGLLVGLKSGAVLRVYLNNPFPIPLVRHTSAIRCLDISKSRTKLALVDEHSSLFVYDCATGVPLWSDVNAASAAWNADFEDMLCYSGGGLLSIKTGVFPSHTQKLPGFVVGFAGSKVFSLQTTTTVSVDIPQSAAMHAFIERGEKGDWEEAYKVACLGVTPQDWRALGLRALQTLELGVARAAFLRALPLDMRYIELINHFEALQRLREGSPGAPPKETSPAALLAEVLAYGGDYAGAARAHLEAGTVERALEMFTDLKLWKEARRFAESVGSGRLDVSSLLIKQAVWCEESGDVSAAATIYAGLGQPGKAVALLGERAMWGPLMDLVRTLPSAPPSTLLLQQPTAGIIGAAAAAAAAGAAAAGAGRERSDSLNSLESIDDAVFVGMESVGGEGGSGGAGGSSGSSGSSSSGSSEGLSKAVRGALGDAGAYLTRAGLLGAAREVYTKLGDVRALVQLHIDAGEWLAAHRLASETEAACREAVDAAHAAGGGGAHSSTHRARLARDLATARGIVSHVHLCRGEALAGVDKFEEALKAYEAGGRPDLTARILSDLAAAALEEGRYGDASLHYQRLARESWGTLEALCGGSGGGSLRGGGSKASSSALAATLAALRTEGGIAAVCLAGARYRRFSHYADLYSAYEVIHSATAKPFSMEPPATVFHAARYILNAVAGPTSANASASASSTPFLGRLPFRLSLARTLYALAKTALQIGGFATARRALEPLASGSLLVPPAWRDRVEVMALEVATAPTSDAPELGVTCPRCKALQPPLAVTSTGDFAALVPSPPPPSTAPRGGSGSGGSPPGGEAVGSTAAGAAPAAALFLPQSDPGLAAFLSPWHSAVSGDACTTCGCPFVRSSLTYEVLPLVEFVPTQGCGLRAALTLLAEEAPLEVSKEGKLGGALRGGPTATTISSSSSSSSGSQSLVFGAAAAVGSGGGGGGGAGGGSGEGQMLSALAAAAERASEARARGGEGGGAAKVGGGIPLGVTTVPPPILKLLKPSDVFLVRAAPPPTGSAGSAVGGASALSKQGGLFSGGGGAGGSSSGSAGEGGAPLCSGTILQLCAKGALFPSAAEELAAPPRLFFHTAAAEVDIATSAACGRLFHMEDLELAVLTTGYCPFSRAPAEEVGI
jgi:tetratricopeptide (TPR) repeat protein